MRVTVGSDDGAERGQRVDGDADPRRERVAQVSAGGVPQRGGPTAAGDDRRRRGGRGRGRGPQTAADDAARHEGHAAGRRGLRQQVGGWVGGAWVGGRGLGGWAGHGRAGGTWVGGWSLGQQGPRWVGGAWAADGRSLCGWAAPGAVGGRALGGCKIPGRVRGACVSSGAGWERAVWALDHQVGGACWT